MAIDKTQSDAILNTFRQMVADCKTKGYTGESFDKMCSIMNEMETLANEMNDLAAFSAKLTTSGYFVNFSNEYGRLLSDVATKHTSNTSPYDDNTLLQQTIKSYEDSLKYFDNHKDKEMLTKAVQDIITLGKSGINYPNFLRLMIEQGLDKAMQGSILNRKYLVEDVAFAQKTIQPAWERKVKAVLNKYDEMAAQSTLRIPNNTLFSLERFKIENDHEADVRRYNHIRNLWQTIFSDLHWWIDAYTRFAPKDERYIGQNESETRKNIYRIKNINPGKIKAALNILEQNYQLTWIAIFKHETFDAEYRSNRFNYTEQYICFIKEDVFNQCIPLKHAAKALIEKAEALYNKALITNPEEHKIPRKSFAE